MALGADDPVVIKPDFWVSFLWKRLLGSTVLNATASSRDVRAYAFSGAPPSVFAEPSCGGAPLQLLLINLRNTTAAVALPASQPAKGRYALWALAPSAVTALSDAATLNSLPLPGRIDVQAGAPAFLERIATPEVSGAVAEPLSLPPLSISFLCYT